MKYKDLKIGDIIANNIANNVGSDKLPLFWLIISEDKAGIWLLFPISSTELPLHNNKHYQLRAFDKMTYYVDIYRDGILLDTMVDC